MNSFETLYQPKQPEKLNLSDTDKEAIKNITLSIDEVDEDIRHMALPDIIDTLQNGHPLNKLITDTEGNLSGYIACEDFVPKEAYIKYLGTNRQSGRNLIKEIPAFFNYAKEHGYTKLSFHGWNRRLNTLLKRFGFERTQTTSMNGYHIDLFEKDLRDTQSPEEVTQERIRAFEQKYIAKLTNLYTKTLSTFTENKEEIQKRINDTIKTITPLIADTITLNEKNTLILQLKLARHFQNNDTIDTNVLADALMETPKFIEQDKGSLHRLFEVHEQKTLIKIAELRKKKAEQKDSDETLSPYEALFTTPSSNYYMARLLNMPHLEEESAYMNHCVGTSDSYISRMKKER